MENATIRMTGMLEPRSGWTADRCSLAKTLEVVHTRSALLVLREAFYGATRFDEFAERTGLSEPITAARLRELVDQGMLRREPYQEPGARTRRLYRLTDKGAELLPALVALMQWGDRWLQPEGQAPIELRHEDCGGVVSARLRCEHGHDVAAHELAAARSRRPPRD
ncbi:MAG: winged helix-turn-helix transcriptional regulator [Solirubrobacteraceae bacterium]